MSTSIDPLVNYAFRCKSTSTSNRPLQNHHVFCSLKPTRNLSSRGKLRGFMQKPLDFHWNPMSTLTQPVQTNSQQISSYLQRCNKRGNSLRSNQKCFPNYRQLAKLCFLDPSTIGRIASGKQKSVQTVTSDILLALSGIAPPTSHDMNQPDMQEQWSRVCDAQQALDDFAQSADDVLDYIMQGIEERLQAN